MSVWISPELRGSGAAIALEDAADAWTRTRGSRTLWLHVGADNLRDRHVYERQGVRESGHGFRARSGPIESQMKHEP